MSQKNINLKVYDATLGILSGDTEGRLEQLLQDILEYEKNHPPKTKYDGFEWYDVHGYPRTLNKLVIKRVLNIVSKTNKYTSYQTVDSRALEKALRDYQGTFEAEEERDEIPQDLFHIVIGHDDKKEIIMRCLASEKPLHCLLWGSVASAKTLILEELARLPRNHFVLGSSMTKVGLYECLSNERPKYLLIDELDKMDDASNLSVLLSLMERGMIKETKHRRHRPVKLKTWVFASANRTGKIPIELLSRFIRLKFRDYTENEFIEVVVNILKDREGISEPLALYIGHKVQADLRSRDVRDTVKVARLLTRGKTREEVDRLINILKKQR